MIKTKRRAAEKLPEIHFKFPGGVCYDAESEIRDDQCAIGTQNILFNGKVNVSRPGQAYVYPTTLGAGAVNGFYDFKKKNGTVITLLNWGTGLYTQTGSSQPASIINTLANVKPAVFVDSDTLFLLNGTDFKTYDGVTVADVTSGAYVPTLTSNRKPNASASTPNESKSYVSNTYWDSFDSDGTAVYTLSETGLTSIDQVLVNGAIKTAGTDYTVNVAAGTVTLTTAPAAYTGTNTNNVKIKWTKSGYQDANLIKNCRYIGSYNGHYFATGNPNYPNHVFWTGIVKDNPAKNPYYWPIYNTNILKDDVNSKNTGFAVHNGALLIFKEKSIHRATPSTSASFDFDWHPVNLGEGCDMPYTIQLIDNAVVFANSYKGVRILRSTIIQDERNVDSLSVNINGSEINAGLLNEQVTVLQQATSLDDGLRYWLCVGNKAWVWDYTNSPYSGDGKKVAWWYMTNINANCWLQRDKDIYYGDRTTGLVAKLTPGVYNDFGTAIPRDIVTKKTNFGKPEWEKDIPRGYITLRSGTMQRPTLTYVSDSELVVDTSININSIGPDYDNFDWDSATYDAENNNKTIPLEIDATGTVEFQVRISNHNLNEAFVLIGLSVLVSANTEVSD